jgi:iron complex transport system substrate-binding protein
MPLKDREVNSGPPPAVYLDSLGRDFVLEKPVSRVVSLLPAATEILFAIGAGDLAVGITEYCDYPPEAQSLPRVGGFSGATVSVEQIAMLMPGLVLISADMHYRIADLLDELGIPFFAVEPRNFADVYSVISIIGELTGREEGAGRVIAGMKEKLKTAEIRAALSIEKQKKSGADPEIPSVFWVLSSEPLMSIGGNTILNEAIKLAGGRNIFEDMKEDWPLVSFEEVLKAKPDWILSADDMGSALDTMLLSRREFSRLIPAVEKGRTVNLDADLVYRYGPRLADGVLAITALLHP